MRAQRCRSKEEGGLWAPLDQLDGGLGPGRKGCQYVSPEKGRGDGGRDRFGGLFRKYIVQDFEETPNLQTKLAVLE